MTGRVEVVPEGLRMQRGGDGLRISRAALSMTD